MFTLVISTFLIFGVSVQILTLHNIQEYKNMPQKHYVKILKQKPSLYLTFLKVVGEAQFEI